MDSEEEILYDAAESSIDSNDVDSDRESSGTDAEFAIEIEPDNLLEESNEVEQYAFQVLSTEEIVQHMIDTIREINTVVYIPATTTRMLLNHFKWDKQQLMERLFHGDQDKLFADAHVINPFKKGSENLILAHGSNDTEECGICFLALPSSMLTGLECDHQFCTSCWSEYLTTKIMEDGECQTIACAAHACDILVDDAVVMSLIQDPTVKSKYQHLITNSFVECNRLLSWCPIPNCNNIIKVQDVEMKPVTCKCNHVFCFQCSENWHEPLECRLLRKWNKKCNDSSETSNWINVNTKECPKCNVPIEKNGGCNYMTCRNLKCRTAFCWVCLTPGIAHSFKSHGCNLFSKDEKALNDSLERYLFYWNRYMTHTKSLKFESQLHASVAEKMEEMQQQHMSWIEVQYLKKAVDVLCCCRQTLLYTYVFAFYLRKSNQSVIFEANQADLETATECLSEYLERDITTENVLAIKQKVQDKYRYCDSRRKQLLSHVHKGYDYDLWEFMD